jgi:hypothetical protein
MQTKIRELIHELDAYDEQRRQPFPREDCRKITEGDSDKELDLVGDLNTYDMTITGSISWGEKIVDWPSEKINRLLKYTNKPFFEAFPEYKFLEPLITKTNTPDLYEDILLHEKIRLVLIELLTLLLNKSTEAA